MLSSRGTCSPTFALDSKPVLLFWPLSALMRSRVGLDFYILTSKHGAEGDFGWSSWLLRWPGRPFDVSSCLWRRWGERCPDSPLLWPGYQLDQSVAKPPGGRAQLEASALGRSSGAGRWSPGPPGWRLGSNPWGSWSLTGRCSGRSLLRFRPGRGRRRSVARMSPHPGSTGQRSVTQALQGPALGRQTQGCPAEGDCSVNCWAGQHHQSLWLWPLAVHWSCGQPAGSQAGKRDYSVPISPIYNDHERIT